MAAVELYVGVSYADTTTPVPNALVLHWLALQHSLWGSVEVFESALVASNSPLILHVAAVFESALVGSNSPHILPVAAVKLYVGVSYADASPKRYGATLVGTSALPMG